jgi:hypothetical protein
MQGPIPEKIYQTSLANKKQVNLNFFRRRENQTGFESGLDGDSQEAQF